MCCNGGRWHDASPLPWPFGLFRTQVGKGPWESTVLCFGNVTALL